ncbi:hypothetical protein LEN26_013591 [Aphanomyces euteiches]|uniref:Uncharacterized protein n=1 Tax=Aphanomyces euteiches TaxID=100861 RepID=A0A6G0WBF4_9STRA|nr:hypothetical protein Ae201684_016799 [Aphanomyces euteiches]KAH9110917.1 hypothetical protein LEN26_013591 [Aphanomyces euteiches]KAH9128727.1 hypothetical protein AeMF1_001159 [Aphanomyces euteiches]KAH9156163.1 hypothetical protein AeRB84_001920 [Aphanomyces euteiches]KAH9193570.1 hypothetical protein AeNC1_004446 [Aphanomyces euteiches]
MEVVEATSKAADDVTPREMLSRYCSFMLALSVLSFMFIYSIWWMALFTIAVALAGYIAAEMIKETHVSTTRDVFGSSFSVSSNKIRARRQIMLAEYFYYASFLVCAFQCGGEAMLLVSMTVDMSYSYKNGWEIACMLLGSICIVALIYTTVLTAHLISHSHFVL